jgi:hypothetical protein
MREHLIWMWSAHRRYGRRTVSDEGLDKDRCRVRDLPPGRDLLPLTPVETRAGQYMRRLRRLAAARRG